MKSIIPILLFIASCHAGSTRSGAGDISLPDGADTIPYPAYEETVRPLDSMYIGHDTMVLHQGGKADTIGLNIHLAPPYDSITYSLHGDTTFAYHGVRVDTIIYKP